MTTFADRVASVMFHSGKSREQAARQVANAACVPLGEVLDALPEPPDPPRPRAPGGILSAEEVETAISALHADLAVPRRSESLRRARLRAVIEALVRCQHGARLEALPSDAELAAEVLTRHVGVLPEPDIQSEGALAGYRRGLPPAEEPPFDDPHGRDPVG